MFHGVRDWTTLPSSRYFRMAERLHLRGGAVTHALADRQRATPTAEVPLSYEPAPPTERPGGMAPRLEVATLASMSQRPGFPGIAYTSGG